MVPSHGTVNNNNALDKKHKRGWIKNNNNKKTGKNDSGLSHTLLLCLACSRDAEKWKQRQGTPMALATST